MFSSSARPPHGLQTEQQLDPTPIYLAQSYLQPVGYVSVPLGIYPPPSSTSSLAVVPVMVPCYLTSGQIQYCPFMMQPLSSVQEPSTASAIILGIAKQSVEPLSLQQKRSSTPVRTPDSYKEGSCLRGFIFVLAQLFEYWARENESPEPPYNFILNAV